MSTITVDGKDLQVIEQVDICDGLVKKILKYGEGERPSSGNMCSMHYTGVLSADDSKFDSSRDRQEPFEFQVGVGQVIGGWDQGVVTMKKGEEAVLCINADLGYGASGAGAAIPPNADLNFHVELLDFFEKPKEMWEMSEEEKMTYAEDRKREGNLSLKQGDYIAAGRCYEEGLKSFEGKDLEELTDTYKMLKQSLHSNQCIAMLKSNNFVQAKLHAVSVLKMDEKNIKATYNFIQACDKLGEFEAALREVKNILEREDLKDSDRQMFERQQGLVKSRSVAQDKKEKAVYSKMFA